MSSGMGGGGRGQSPERVKSDKEDGAYRANWPAWLVRIADKFKIWVSDNGHTDPPKD